MVTGSKRPKVAWHGECTVPRWYPWIKASVPRGESAGGDDPRTKIVQFVDSVPMPVWVADYMEALVEELVLAQKLMAA